MSSTTTIVAQNVQYQSWLNMIRECNNRPEHITVKEWCSEHGIKPAAYYWRMKRLRELCLNNTNPAESIPSFVEMNSCLPADTSSPKTINLYLGNSRLEIPEAVSDSFLTRILEAASHVK